jgi:hypothetical protein
MMEDWYICILNMAFGIIALVRINNEDGGNRTEDKIMR